MLSRLLLVVALLGFACSQTIVEELALDSDYISFAQLVGATNLASTLVGDGPFTVLAPNNDAILNGLTGQLILDKIADGSLEQILLDHVVDGKVMSNDLSEGQEITTKSGMKLTVSISDGVVTFTGPHNSAKVVKPDVVGSNGVFHGIDTVLTTSSSSKIMIGGAIASAVAGFALL